MEKRLYRSRTDRMVAGVCGGLGEYLGIDPTVIRIAFVLVTLWGGIGPVVYLVLWLAVPESPLLPAPAPGEGGTSVERRASSEPAVIVGVALIAAGALFLLRNMGFFWPAWLDGRVAWPAVLIALGLILLIRRSKGE